MALKQLIILTIITTLTYSDDDDDCDIGPFVSRIASANRGSGEGLLIESDNELAQIILTLPENAEPMYISASPLTNEFYIGDRTNEQLIVYDTTTLQQTNIISTNCSGIFHQFYNFKNQLWVVCDQDDTILVIDTQTQTAITTIIIANISDGYQPHDITTTTKFAYVTLLSPGTGLDGFIIQYNTNNFAEENRLRLGADPHVFINPFEEDPDYLFVAAQGASTVYKVDANDLTIEDTVTINGAHGIWGNSDYMYVTDITSGDGVDSLYVIDTGDLSFRVYDAKISAPHNVMINSDGDKMFITHTGPGFVTVYDILGDGGLDDVNGRVIFEESGSLPFGIMNLIGLSEYNVLTACDDDSSDSGDSSDSSDSSDDDAVVVDEVGDISDHAMEENGGDDFGGFGYNQWLLGGVSILGLFGMVGVYCCVKKRMDNKLNNDNNNGETNLVDIES